MKIYLAAPWIMRGDMEEMARQLEKAGHTITHRWWAVEDVAEDARSHEVLAMQAMADYHGVHTADALVVLNSSKSEGKAVEQGIAIAQGKSIVAIGQLGAVSKNVFHYLSNYTWVPNLDAAIETLTTVGKE